MKKKFKLRRELLLLLPLALLLLLKLLLSGINERREQSPADELTMEIDAPQPSREIPREQLRDLFHSTPSDIEPQEETLSDDDPEID